MSAARPPTSSRSRMAGSPRPATTTWSGSGRRARLHRRAAHQPRGDRAARTVPGGWCPVSSEYFAISGDVHLVLGHLAPDAYDCPTPDGRAATAEFARERIARLVCSDVEQLDADGIDAIAASSTATAAPARGGGAPGAAHAPPPAPPSSWPARAPSSGGRSPRVWGGPSPTRHGARPTARSRPPRRSPRCWRRARADRRQGRRRAGPRSGRRRAARAVHHARRGSASATRCSSFPAAPGSPTPCARPTAASRCPPTTSHRMAVLGMEQFGWLLSELIPGAGRSAQARLDRPGTTVLLPAALTLDGLPASWRVTSDSIAAWVAGRGRRRPPRARQGGRRPVRASGPRTASRSPR